MLTDMTRTTKRLNLLSRDLMIQSLHERTATVQERLHLLQQARQARNEIILTLKEMQVPMTQIARVANLSWDQVQKIIDQQKRRRDGVRLGIVEDEE